MAGNDDCVRFLLKYGADVNFESYYSGYTVLGLASRDGYESIVQILIYVPGIKLDLSA